jgi:tetratricopeptide (TPR) repeat protein
VGDSNKFWITDDDKYWVQERFRWLLSAYGYPYKSYKSVVFIKEFFPETFSRKLDVDSLITDLCNLYKISKQQISVELTEDIRDSPDTPYEIHGKIIESHLFVDKSCNEFLYKINLSKSLLKHPGQLLINLEIIFIKITLTESKIEYEDLSDADEFVYLVGIFVGHGVILYQNLLNAAVIADTFFWRRTWKYVSDIPVPVMAYALALYYNLKEEDTPDWMKYLSVDFQKQYEGAIKFIKKDSNPFFDKAELEARQLLQQAYSKSDQYDFDGAIEDYQKILFLTKDDILRSSAYNNIGYDYLRKKEYIKSIPFFQKALEIRPSFGYANDNLGFAFIMGGDLESGKFYLNAAMKTEDNDAGYSYRNFALYHQKRKEYKQAEEYFQKAFNNIVIPIDLLEYFYAQFLLEIGENEKGREYLQKGVEKKEPEAIKLMEHLNQKKQNEI